MDKPKQETPNTLIEAADENVVIATEPPQLPKLNRHQRRAEIAILKKKLGKIRAAQNLRNQQKNRKKKGKRNGLKNKD